MKAFKLSSEEYGKLVNVFAKSEAVDVDDFPTGFLTQFGPVLVAYEHKTPPLEQAMKGSEVDLPEFLEWIANRLVNVHKENPNVDYIHSCRNWASKIRKAMEA